MELANWDITMNTSGRNGRLFCCLQLYYEIRWHMSYFYLFKMAGEKSSKEDVSESLKQCCESLASAAEALQKYASTSSPKVTTETTGNNQLKPLEEHRKLFDFKPSTTTTTTTTTRSSATTHGQRSPFYGGPSAKRQRTSSEKLFLPVRNTWTHKFFVFASNTVNEVPTSRQKVKHGLACRTW